MKLNSSVLQLLKDWILNFEMAGKKNNTSPGRWYDPSDWGYTPSQDFKITMRMIPIVLVLILGLSLGLTATGSQGNVADKVFSGLSREHKVEL
ncbi:MAG: hypothetical protein ABIG42_02440, partial [bacterium]